MYVKKHIYIYGNSNSSEMLLLFFDFFFLKKVHQLRAEVC